MQFMRQRMRTFRLGFFSIIKETTLERADFTLQLLMFVTAEKERRMLKNFFLSSFCQLLSPRFKLGQAERVQAMKASTNRPRRQLFLM